MPKLTDLDKTVITNNIVSLIVDLFKSKRNISWVENAYIKIYVRKSTRLYDGKLIECIDLANIDVVEEYKSQGLFTQVLDRLLIEFPDSNFFVESILNPRLIPFLKRKGFVQPDESSHTSSSLQLNDVNMFLIR